MKLSPVIKQFLLYFIANSLLLGIVIGLFYQADIEFHQHLIESQETAQINLQSKAISFHFQNIESDLALISELYGLRKLASGNESVSSKELEYDFLSISLRKGIYDQIRFISKTGMELLRVNYNMGKPYLVPNEQLQNKAGRYYFKNTMILNKEKVYVSPLDLNIERGEIEKPNKPMIRFGTPIFNIKNEKQGVLILNFLAQFMIDSFEKSRQDWFDQHYLLNSDGYWLSSPIPEDEWGFMLNERENKSFSNRFPNAWTIITKEETGQFITSEGLFTFSTFYPTIEAQKLKNVIDKTRKTSVFSIKANYWKIVSFVPQETLNEVLIERSKNLQNTLILLFTFLVILIGIASFLFVNVGEQKKKVEQDLRNSITQLEEFAYIVSHDLKTPLRGISSLAGWIVEDYKEVLDEKGRKWLNRLLQRTEHMNTLITGILHYSKVSRNNQKKVKLSSSQVVSEVVKSLDYSENIKVQVDGELPNIYYNQTQLEQVFQNLIENAIKHMGKPEGIVVISCRDTGRFVEFCVSDNGIGIEEEHYERIFKMFQGLNPEKEDGNTGIGLALVKKIINNNNGTVWVKSKKGEGSTFYFTIPKRLKIIRHQIK